MSKSGWHYLINSPKWHYFGEDGHSICGRWFTFASDFEQGNDDSPDNCKSCQKKLIKMKELECV